MRFVPTTTYLGIIGAYILLPAGGSGCFKARTNDSVGWVVTPPDRKKNRAIAMLVTPLA